MKVTHFEEQEDGSATVQLDMDAHEQEKLIELGFTTLLKQYIEEAEETTDE